MGQDLTRISASSSTSSKPVALLVLLGLLVSFEWSVPGPAASAVEVAAGSLSEQERKAMKELVEAFDRAEQAVQQGDVEALMPFYAPAYNYHGLKRSDVRRVWEEVFAHYRAVSSKHVFTEAKLARTGGVTKAYVTCTGGLYGTEKQTGKPVTIDSWVHEIHYLVKEQGAWRFYGNAGGTDPSTPAASAPHHPLF
jgi:ketosteroid isomerase-like protein